MLRYGKFPYGIGSHLTFKVHQPLNNSGNPDELIDKVEQEITSGVTSF